MDAPMTTVPTVDWLINYVPDIDMKWIEALIEWNKDKPTWCFPRKDTPEYEEVRRLMTAPAPAPESEPPKSAIPNLYWSKVGNTAGKRLDTYYSVRKEGTGYIAYPVAYKLGGVLHKGGYDNEKPTPVKVYPRGENNFMMPYVPKGMASNGLTSPKPNDEIHAIATAKSYTPLPEPKPEPEPPSDKVKQDKYFYEVGWKKLGSSHKSLQIWERISDIKTQDGVTYATFKNIGEHYDSDETGIQFTPEDRYIKTNQVAVKHNDKFVFNYRKVDHTLNPINSKIMLSRIIGEPKQPEPAPAPAPEPPKPTMSKEDEEEVARQQSRMRHARQEIIKNIEKMRNRAATTGLTDKGEKAFVNRIGSFKEGVKNIIKVIEEIYAKYGLPAPESIYEPLPKIWS